MQVLTEGFKKCSTSRAVKGFQNDFAVAGRQLQRGRLRQNNRCRAGIFRINQNQRHAGAAVFCYFGGDDRRSARVIGQKCYGIDFLELCGDGIVLERGFDDGVARHTPTGGEIHQYRLPGGARLRDGFRRPRLPVNSA